MLCGNAERLLPEWQSESIDCVVTSPPYWGRREYGIKDEVGSEPTVDEYIVKLGVIFDELMRLLKRRGTCWLNLGDGYSNAHRRYRGVDKLSAHRAMGRRHADPQGIKPKELMGLHWRVISELQRRGWYVRAEIIWSKPNSLPESVRDRPMRSHEYIFLLTKSEKYNFRKCFLRDKSGASLRSVWSFAVGLRVNTSNHPAILPLDVADRILRLSCHPGSVVLDPFCGSGTVGLASLRHGCSFVGIDICRQYIRSAKAALLHAGGEASSERMLGRASEGHVFAVDT
jgi:site-specific DNA-methyltransferase (adenine-specific)